MKALAKAISITSLALSLAACGGSVTMESGGAGGSGTDSTGTDSTAAGGAGAGGSGGDTGTTTSTVCVPQEGDPDFEPPTCADLVALTITTPVLQDESGDGKLSPGEKATLTVHLEETTGKGFFAYPLVQFSADVGGVSVTNDAILYGIAACQVMEMSTQITVDASVPTGTLVHVGAQVGMLNTECPDAFELSIPVQIQ